MFIQAVELVLFTCLPRSTLVIISMLKRFRIVGGVRSKQCEMWLLPIENKELPFCAKGPAGPRVLSCLAVVGTSHYDNSSSHPPSSEFRALLTLVDLYLSSLFLLDKL